MFVHPVALPGKPQPFASVSVYSDADWAGGPERRSTSGHVVHVMLTKGWYPLVAISRRQSCVSLSSGEGELAAAVGGICEGLGVYQTLLRTATGLGLLPVELLKHGECDTAEQSRPNLHSGPGDHEAERRHA